ncbi:MAG TPA: hypothetical protein VD859_04995 [Nocardioides sp.]|nr:hypothetical protein [Nocardioides sp.]
MRKRSLRTAAVAWLPVFGLTLVLLASPGSPQATGSLDVSPGEYYGGQMLTWTGDLGTSGRTRIKLQKNLSRAGDKWEPVLYFPKTYTQSDGSFSFRWYAPAMNDIRYRVVGGGAATSDWTFQATHQDITVTGGTPNPCGNDLVAVVGEQFELTVDTAPGDNLVLEGRDIRLEQRTGGASWTLVENGAAGNNGRDDFTVSAGETGSAVYRAIQEDWTANGDEVGWFPSFPTYVEVVTRPEPATDLTATASLNQDGVPQVDLQWQLPDDPTISEVILARVEGTGTPTVDDVWANLPPGTETYTDFGVSYSTTYTYAVFVRNEYCFDATDAPTDQATIPDEPPPPPPPDPQPRTRGAGS